MTGSGVVGNELFSGGQMSAARAILSGNLSSSVGSGLTMSAGIAIQSLVNDGTITSDQMKRIALFGGGAIGLGVFSAAMHKIYASLMQKTITSEGALEETKNILNDILSNAQEFPTIQTKLDALKYLKGQLKNQSDDPENRLPLVAINELEVTFYRDPLFTRTKEVDSFCNEVKWDIDTINAKRK